MLFYAFLILKTRVSRIQLSKSGDSLYKSKVYNLGNNDLFNSSCKTATEEAQRILESLNESKYACLNVVKEDYENEIVQLEVFAKQWHERFDDVVVVGTGGSCLGAAAAIISIAQQAKPN